MQQVMSLSGALRRPASALPQTYQRHSQRFASMVTAAPAVYRPISPIPTQFTPGQHIRHFKNSVLFFIPIFAAAGICTLSNRPDVLKRWESRALFQPYRVIRQPHEFESSLLQKHAQSVRFPAEDGTPLHGWYFNGDPEHRNPTVLIAHGMRGNNTDMEGLLEGFVRRGYNVFAPDFRGYGNSGGKPEETLLYSDFEAASEFVASRFNAPRRQKQIAFGFSMGTAVITGASQNLKAKGEDPFRLLVMSGALTSTADVFGTIKRANGIPAYLFPIERKIRQTFDSLSRMPGITSPTLFVHSVEDELTPYAMSESLEAAATGLAPHQKTRITLSGVTHNQMFDRLDFMDPIINSIETLANQTREAPHRFCANG